MANPLRLLDLSNVNGPVNWPLLAQSGIDGVILKASEGTGFTDPQFATNWDAAGQHGLVRHAYHFLRRDLNLDPAAEAQHCAAVLPALAPHEMVWCDAELANGPIGAAVEEFCGALGGNAKVASEVDVYSYYWFIVNELQYAPLGQRRLWLASYQNAQPTVPWPWRYYTLWQHTSNARYPGINGVVDESYFYGDRAQLEGIGKAAPPPPVVVQTPRHLELTTAMHLRPHPKAEMPWGVLLPVGTKVVEINPPNGLPREYHGWAYVRTSGDVRGWCLLSNCRSYTP
jgi:GH25 family lysozyme M1 (1,4-beta-N-acetylmuramidase)